MSRRTKKQMSEATTRKLLAVARQRFAEDGYAATSMDALCAEAGLTRGALYHHFGGKDGLLEAVVREIDLEIAEALETAWAEAEAEDPWDALRDCCARYLEIALEPEVQRVYLRDAAAVLGQRLRDIDAESSLAAFVTVLEQLMEQGRIRPADPEAMARILSGAMMDAALWIASSEAPEQVVGRAQGAVDVLLEGLSLREGRHR